MFNFLKKKAAPTDIRDTLFGDMPIDSWIANNSTSDPWNLFADAEHAIRDGKRNGAIELLKNIAGRTDIETRHLLTAWHALRGLEVQPSESIAGNVLGVVVEVGLEGGTDLVAAYADHSARYYNYSGSGVVWEAPDGSLDSAIDALIAAGQQVANNIGPWTDPRPPAPANGDVRINMLAPGGLYFGQAPFALLATDGMGGPVISAAMTLMEALIAKQEAKP
ncbi:MAG: hypothetical protein JWQ98_2231 [Chlorobi bacterium]|nr:hypothetical protein [Chlorobiota bacterium]